MANARELKERMASIQETKNITNAMYLISSSKMKQAKKKLADTEPFFYAMQAEITRILRHVPDMHSHFFDRREKIPAEERKVGCIVITADKGLAGAYNLNVIRETMQLFSDHQDTKLFVVGEYGRQFFSQHHIPIERSFLYTAQNPTMHRAREISAILLDLFNAGELDKIFVVYTDMKNGLDAEAVSTRLLPFHRRQFTAGISAQNTARILQFSMPNTVKNTVESSTTPTWPQQ